MLWVLVKIDLEGNEMGYEQREKVRKGEREVKGNEDVCYMKEREGEWEIECCR